MKDNSQILGLALGGGAFRGTAHLGVLKALEEEGLRPGFLCGIAKEQLRWLRLRNLKLV